MNPQPPVIKSETMLLYAKKGLSLGRVYFYKKEQDTKLDRSWREYVKNARPIRQATPLND